MTCWLTWLYIAIKFCSRYSQRTNH